jgi:hypothetical protein
MRRVVKTELLDNLPPADPQAVGSRDDLRRLNFLMGHTGLLTRVLRRHLEEQVSHSRPLRLIELGAGDGTFMLRLARRWSVLGVTAEVTLLDRQKLVSPETRRGFAALDWVVESVETDVFAWLESSAPIGGVMMANLFLHHFQDEQLARLLRLAARKTTLFLACEPRRSPLALAVAHSLALLGCNATTKHDAAVSVRSGFAGEELTVLWPADAGWSSTERPAGLFSHCFLAKRNV